MIPKLNNGATVAAVEVAAGVIAAADLLPKLNNGVTIVAEVAAGVIAGTGLDDFVPNANEEDVVTGWSSIMALSVLKLKDDGADVVCRLDPKPGFEVAT